MTSDDYQYALHKAIGLVEYDFGTLSIALSSFLLTASCAALMTAAFMPIDQSADTAVSLPWYSLDVPKLAIHILLLAGCIILTGQFIVECRNRLSNNFDEMGAAFAMKVAERQGDIKFSELKKQKFPELRSTIAFVASETSGYYTAHSHLYIHEAHANEVPNLFTLIDSNPDFTAYLQGDNKLRVTYRHDLRGEELGYLAAHGDVFWRAKTAFVFQVQGMLVFGLIAIFAIIGKLAWVYLRTFIT